MPPAPPRFVVLDTETTGLDPNDRLIELGAVRLDAALQVTERFSTLVGMPPIRYLTALRLQTAKLLLREATTTIGQLAHSVGYDSEEAFSRAFKREFGMAPGRWRGGGTET